MTDAALTRSVSTSSLTEDWLAVWIGLPIFALALLGVAGPDLLGWAVTTSVWTDPAKALGTASKAYAGIGGVWSPCCDLCRIIGGSHGKCRRFER